MVIFLHPPLLLGIRYTVYGIVMLQVNVLEGDSFRRTRLLRMLFSNFFHHSGKINADILEGGFLPFDTMQSRSILRGVFTLTDTMTIRNRQSRSDHHGYVVTFSSFKSKHQRREAHPLCNHASPRRQGTPREGQPPLTQKSGRRKEKENGERPQPPSVYEETLLEHRESDERPARG